MMINTFVDAFLVKNAYNTNQFIYALQRLPLVGKLISNKLYGKNILKVISVIVAVFVQLVKVFGYKLLYIFCFITLPLGLFNNTSSDLIMHIYLFLALIGCFTNTEIFNPTKDKYYNIVLLKMDAKKLAIVNFLYFLITTWLGQLVALILLTNIMWYDALLLVNMLVFLKVIAISIYIFRIKKTNEVINENKPKSWFVYIGLILIGLIFSYVVPYFGFVIPYYVFYLLVFVGLILFLVNIKNIFSFDGYQRLYKRLLINDNFVLNTSESNALQKNTLKQITLDVNITSNKEGYAYFHELFVKRHRKILGDSAKMTTIFIIFVFVIFLFLTLINDGIRVGVNNFILLFLPYLLFIMYFINTGKSITNAMFMNCDHSMLTYRFYRNPKVILSLFKERLKTIIIINLIPTLVLAFSLCILLLVSGGTDNVINYLIILMAVLSMSIFFSVHYLVLYYLLQPYSIGMQMKSATYNVITIITYWACYYIAQIRVSSFIFGLIMILFAIVYTIISLILVYFHAPKTFRLR